MDLFATTKTLVEGALVRFGVDPATVRVHDDAPVASWALKRGSASVLVSVTTRPSRGEQDGDAVFLRVVSPVIFVPSGEKSALYQHLLELNANGLVNAAFGVLGEHVVAVSERPAKGLDESEVEQVIKHTSAVADTYDDRLAERFGGKRVADGP
jgi:hypothetical protein